MRAVVWALVLYRMMRPRRADRRRAAALAEARRLASLTDEELIAEAIMAAHTGRTRFGLS